MVFDTEWEHEEMGRRLNLNKPAHNAPTGIMRFMRQPSSGDAMTPTPTRPEPMTRDLLRACERLIDDYNRKYDIDGKIGPVQQDVYNVAKWAKQRLTSEPAGPDEHGQTPEDYEELGRSFFEEYNCVQNDPAMKGYICADSPVEIIPHLLNAVGNLKAELALSVETSRQLQSAIDIDTKALVALVEERREPEPAASVPVTREQIMATFTHLHIDDDSEEWQSPHPVIAGREKCANAILALLAASTGARGAVEEEIAKRHEAWDRHIGALRDTHADHWIQAHHDRAQLLALIGGKQP